nr:helix-turn-helix domain-containing GNAT family N-acetyltransferase [Streptomyces sp. M1013]
MPLRDLRPRLGLDAGYLSRMVRSLRAQGMVRLGTHPDDSRMRTVEPTGAGRAEAAEQNRRADVLASGLLEGLAPDQRRRLSDAMATAQRLLRLAAVTVVPVDARTPDARACLDARFPEGFDPADLVGPAEVSGDAGAFFLAYEEGRPVGCGALRRTEPGVGEIKHVWVHSGARRLGLARRLLDALETEAAARGLAVVRLDTHPALTEARAMYERAGYTEIPAYSDHVYAGHRFEKRLPGA